MNRKQRIVHGQGASNITYSTVVFIFDVCQLSQPVSSTNYDMDGPLDSPACKCSFPYIMAKTIWQFTSAFMEQLVEVLITGF